MRSLKILVAAFCALALPITAHSADSAALVDAAKKEGTIVWYTGFIVNQVAKPLADAFEKKYPGIKVQIFRGSATDQLTKINAEVKANRLQGDVVDGSTTVFPLKADGLLAPLPTSILTEIPAEHFEQDRLWVRVSRYFMTTAYNSQMVSDAEAPKTWQDLLDPKWKDKIAWALDWQVNGPPGFMYNIFETMGREKGLEYLTALSKQNVVIVPTAQRALLDQVIGGQYPVVINVFMHHVAISARQGAPVKWVKMEPVLQTSSHVALLKGSPHPNAGKLFIDFFLSREGQEVLAKGGYIPVREDTQTSLAQILPENAHYKVNKVDVEKVYKSMAEYRPLFKQLFGQ